MRRSWLVRDVHRILLATFLLLQKAPSSRHRRRQFTSVNPLHDATTTSAHSARNARVDIRPTSPPSRPISRFLSKMAIFATLGERQRPTTRISHEEACSEMYIGPMGPTLNEGCALGRRPGGVGDYILEFTPTDLILVGLPASSRGARKGAAQGEARHHRTQREWRPRRRTRTCRPTCRNPRCPSRCLRRRRRDLEIRRESGP